MVYKNISTNTAKRFLNLLDKPFSKDNKLHKFFKKNSAKVSYSCTEKRISVISAHNKKLLPKTPTQCHHSANKNKCRLNGKCRARSILYNWVASKKMKSDKAYLGTTERDFKQCFYNHKSLSTVLIAMR